MKIIDLVAPVAAELGPDWRAESVYDHSATLTNGTVSLFASWVGYGTDARRIAFHPTYEGKWYDHVPYGKRDEVRPETTVARDRAPKAIARQIERTVLPAAVEWTPVIAERIAEHDRARDAQHETAARLAALVGATPREGEVSLYNAPGNIYGRLRVGHGGDSIRFEDLSGLSAEQAEAIIRVVMG